jgi:hypothetical protein
MDDKKIYLLAELTIAPGFLEEVKAILKEALIPTLQEPGCEALYETGRKDDPHKLAGRQALRSAKTDQIERTLTWAHLKENRHALPAP